MIFKKISNYPKYKISESGDVFSEKFNKILRPLIVQNGYKTVMLSNELGPKRIKVHRLVLETFGCKMDGKPYVNHKDGNKLNNHISNLE